MNPQIADQVRALQKMSKLYPGRKKENAAKIQALMSNENVQNSQMAKSGKTESFTNGLVGALAKFSPVNILGSGMGYAGRVLNNKTLTETGEGLSEPIRQSQRDFQKQAGSQMSYQAGNIAGGIASSLGNPAGKAGMVLSMLRYGLPSAGDTSQAIQESGGSRTAQAIGGGLTGVAEGGLGAMLNYGTLASVPKSSPLFSTVARRALTAGVAGATENAGTQTIENLVAQRTYDKERPWYMNVPQAAATGAAMGAATRAAPEIYKNRKPLNEGGYLKVGETGEVDIDPGKSRISPESQTIIDIAKSKNITNGQDLKDALRPVERDVIRKMYKTLPEDLRYDRFLQRDVGTKITAPTPKIDDYRMAHRPSRIGATADDITSIKPDLSEDADLGTIPKDFYDNPQNYENMSDPSVRESWAALQSVRGNPDATITIYRATPKKELNDGDWVTLSRKYAKNESVTENTPVYAFKVKAKDIQFSGDSINEFGYFPSKPQAPKKLTSGLQAQAYKDLDSFYNDYRPFFEDNFGDQAPIAAKKFYEASKKVAAMPTGAEGLRASSGAQTEFEQALATNDIVNARKAAVRIDDPVARREAMRSVGLQVDEIPSTENITNPLVKKMMEEALKRKRGL